MHEKSIFLAERMTRGIQYPMMKRNIPLFGNRLVFIGKVTEIVTTHSKSIISGSKLHPVVQNILRNLIIDNIVRHVPPLRQKMHRQFLCENAKKQENNKFHLRSFEPRCCRKSEISFDWQIR